MRSKVTAERLQTFMTELGKRSKSGGCVYFTGGATAMMLGVREQTVDIDMKLDPEPSGVFQAISELKDRLDLNVELASPADFLPVAADWREKSILIQRVGSVEFLHFDLRAQALSKVDRGYEKDLADARAFLRYGKISAAEFRGYFELIRPELIRYPAVNEKLLEAKVNRFLDTL
jgi:hypothetical protein